MKTSSFIKSASSATHLAGVPRRLVLTTVGAFAKLVTSVLNRTRVYNMNTLLELVQSRPPGIPLVTVSNHMIDDPLMWGMKGFPIADPKLTRWTLTAEDICFTNPLFSYFFRLGKCLPIIRGAGIYQPYMNDALDVINAGEWLHTFPEGKLSQEEEPLRRMKWGVASLIARAKVQTIVLPIAHSGLKSSREFLVFEKAPLPLAMKRVSIVVGEPMVFDIPQLRLTAKAMAAKDASSSPRDGNGATCSTILSSSSSGNFTAGIGNSTCSLHLHPMSNKMFVTTGLGEKSQVILDECALRWMHSHMSENLRCVLQDLVLKAQSINKVYG